VTGSGYSRTWNTEDTPERTSLSDEAIRQLLGIEFTVVAQRYALVVAERS
jgi:hypothetical protein